MEDSTNKKVTNNKKNLVRNETFRVSSDIPKLILILQKIIDEHPDAAISYIAGDDSCVYFFDEMEITYLTPETDFEYEKRIQREKEQKQRTEDFDRATYLRLKEKYEKCN